MISYMLFFLMISCVLLLFSFLFAEQILAILDRNFIQFVDTFLILMFGIVGIYIFRGLFGNLLSSIGKAHINYYIASFALIINIITNYYLIPKYGIKGAAITSAILMWFTGIISLIWFWYLYRKLLLNKK
jgi:Na+-driven multidrug efflux pump